jgi:Flp pilus assembly protein TadG
MRKATVKRTRKVNRRRSEGGQTLVELALTAVFMMVLFSVVVDLGRMFFTYVALRDASQEGAAYASIDPWNTEAITARVRASSNTPIDLTSSASISRYNNFAMITPFTGAFIENQSIVLVASEINTILRAPC